MVDSQRRLVIRGLVAAYGAHARPALDNVSVEVEAGRTLAMVGPSGAGKSTFLRSICGLHPVRSGDITYGGASLRAQVPQARRAAMVFADDALLAHLTIAQNLRFVMRKRDDVRMHELADAFGIARHLSRKPSQLSTGERQRASIARALLSDPCMLLLDEPFAALDPDLRVRLRDELLHVRERFSGPIVLVTHDHADAMAVADDLVVLIDGKIQDAGDPQRVYDRPATLGVATFLGDRPMNVVNAWDGDASAIAAFRPERVRIVSDGRFRGRVARLERTGPDAYVHVETFAGRILARVPAHDLPVLQSSVCLEVSDADIVVYRT
jgi:ABC-type sugar transport system ATPase subunit